MSQPYFKIAGGYVYDPLNGVDGQVQDIWVQAGQIVPAPAVGVRADRTLDAAGYVVMPCGVDMHCHIAGLIFYMSRKTRTYTIFQ